MPLREESFRPSRISVMSACMIVHAWSMGTMSGNGLENLWRRRYAQGRRNGQYKRRHNAKGQDSEQNRQREAEYIGRAERKTVHEPGGDETHRRGDHAATGCNLQPGLAMRALHTVRERHYKCRRNRFAAMRADSNSHSSPRRDTQDIANEPGRKSRNHVARANSTRRRIGSMRSARTCTRSPSFQTRVCPPRPETMA